MRLAATNRRHRQPTGSLRPRQAMRRLPSLRRKAEADSEVLVSNEDQEINNIGLKMREEEMVKPAVEGVAAYLKPDLPATWGEVEFAKRLPDRPLSKFACISHKADADDVVSLLKIWIPKPPNVVISVTGSAQQMSLDHELERLILSGLAMGAKSTDAWIVDGGTDTGVMSMVGDAFEATQGEIPLIGIVPWRKLTHKDIFFDFNEEETRQPGPRSAVRAEYVKRRANGPDSTAIDTNHTHFLFVDNGVDSWGGEVDMRAAVEQALRNEFKVPGVTLVVSGGPGTYKTVHAALQYRNPVLLIKESGGCASIITAYVERIDELCKQAGSKEGDDSRLAVISKLAKQAAPEFRERLPKTKDGSTNEEIYSQLIQIGECHDMIHIYSALDEKRASFEMMMLTAVVSAHRRTAELDKRRHHLRARTKHLQMIVSEVQPPHVVARSQDSRAYPERCAVRDEQVPWTYPWPDYRPTRHTDKVVLENDIDRKRNGEGGFGWADPADVQSVGSELRFRRTYWKSGGFGRTSGKTYDLLQEVVEFDRNTKAPLNPRGRTGMAGRGLLGKWGPNHAADPIVTRWHEGKLQMAAIKRSDNGQWAIPGGMVDAGETVSVTVKREFKEEAGNHLAGAEKVEFDRLVEELFQYGEPIYAGYVDDPRNTDNAWMETVAMHFHCSEELGRKLKLRGGDDAKYASWLDIDPVREPRYAELYASHRDWVDRIAERMRDYTATGAFDFYPTKKPMPYETRVWDREPLAYTTGSVNDTPITVEQLNEIKYHRGSFESPILIAARLETPDAVPLPHNPRGRTGIRGRGELPNWGPNHEVITLVTRFDPGHLHRLQVAAIVHHRTDSAGKVPFYEKEPLVQLPSGALAFEEAESMLRCKDRPAEFLRDRVRAARRIFDNPTRDGVSAGRRLKRPRLEASSWKRFLDGVFRVSPDTNTVVHAGYKDDARNTDNAWVESTVIHFHCNHELGVAFPCESFDRAVWMSQRDSDQSSRMCWMDVSEFGMSGAGSAETLSLRAYYGKREQLREAELELVEHAVELLKQRMQSSSTLLEQVARWGRCDVLDFVLSTPDMLEGHCQPEQIQIAFETALRYATKPGFDPNVIDQLLNHGAKPAGLWAPGLLDESATAKRPGGLYDAFGMIEKKTSMSKKWSAANALVVKNMASKSAGRTSPRGRPSSPTRMLSRSEDLRRRLKRGQKDGEDELPSSWPRGVGSREVLDRLIPGFGVYADNQTTIDVIDLAFWATMCGSYELSRCMWARCRCPIRAALLLQIMCVRVAKEKPEFKEQLATFEEHFAAMATGVLDYIGDSGRDGRTPSSLRRKVLTTKEGHGAEIGSRSGRPHTIIELAMLHKRKDFLSHRHFQSVIDELWYGRSPNSGHLMVNGDQLPRRSLLSMLRIVLQALLPFVSSRFLLPIAENTGFDKRAAPLSASLQHVPLLGRILGVYQIPVIKRSLAAISRAALLLIFSYMALLEPCGDLSLVHYIIAVWVVSLAGEEMHQAVTNFELYRANRYMNVLDLLLIALMFAAAGIRLLTVNQQTPTAVDLIDYINQRTDPPFMVRETPTFGIANLQGAPIGCGWTIEIELLRTAMGVVSVVMCVRMLETFALHEETGVLIITVGEMLSRMLAWLPPVFLLALGSAVAMNVLAPQYTTEHSPGPLRLPIDGFLGDFSAGGPFFAPFWAIYGYFDAGSIALGEGTALIAPAFMWLYLLFSLVILVNLLIAIFNDAYTRVQSEKVQLWKMARVQIVHTHMQALALPPPFNLPLLLIAALRNAQSNLYAAIAGDDDDYVPQQGGTRSKRVVPMDGAWGAGAVKPPSEAESIEVQARYRFLHEQPNFEEATGQQIKDISRLFGRIENVRDCTERAKNRLESRLGLIEITNNHHSSETAQRLTKLHDLVERTERTIAIGSVPVGGVTDGDANYIGRARQIFYAFDKDRSGDISVTELSEAIKELGLADTYRLETAAIMKRYDSNGDKGIDLDEFIKLVRDVMTFQKAHREAIRVFERHDDDGSGDLTFNELGAALIDLGFPSASTDEEVRRMLSKYDADGNRSIDLDEFTRLVGDLQIANEKRLRDRRRGAYEAASAPPGMAPTGAGVPRPAHVIRDATNPGADPWQMSVGQVFHSFDKDGSGDIDVAELLPALNALGLETDSDETAMVMKKYDADNSGKLELAEFRVLAKELRAFQHDEAPAATMGRPSWLDEAPLWYKQGETTIKLMTESFENEMQEQVSVLRQQSSSLARVTNHLAQEVARLRPEYWQRAHHASMAAPQVILEPVESFRRAKTHREPPGLHMGVPMVEGSMVGQAYATGGKRAPNSLPSSHPIAHPHDHMRLQRIFADFDGDHDGTLDVSELKGALAALGLPTSGRQAATVLQQYDADLSGRLDFGEFRALAGELAKFKTGPVSDEASRVFMWNDKDGNGRIDLKELEASLKMLGMPTDSYQAAQIMVKYDVDSSGGLELAEFRRLVSELQQFQGKGAIDDDVGRIFRNYDTDRSGTIDASELGNALTALSLPTTSEKTNEILRKYDRDNNGQLDIDEFRTMVGVLRRFQAGAAAPPPAPVRHSALGYGSATTVGSSDFWKFVEDTFRDFDSDKNGQLDSKELTKALNALGLQTTGHQATAILQKYDTHGRGVLSFGDFRACVDELRRFQGGDFFNRQPYLNQPFRAMGSGPPPPPSDDSRRHPRGMVVL